MAGPTLRSTMPACAARPSLLEALESRTHLSVTHAQPHRVANPDVFWYVPPGENEPVEREPRFVPTAQKWPQPGGLATPVSLGYSFSNLLDGGMPGGLTAAQLTAAIVEAMEVWTAVTPLQLTQRIDSGPAAGDGSYLASTHPQLRFGHHFIDGATGLNTLAHAYFPVSSTQANAEGLAGDTHFDNGNTWALTPGGSAIDILETATHEFGHAIGLNHEPTPANGGQLAIMNPVYAGRYSGPGSAFLFADDIAGIQSRYGVGLGYVLDLGGTLHISGTEVANTFSLSVAAGMLSASSVGFGSFTIPAAGVTSIVINGRGGADTFNLGPTGVPVTVNGGAGDDVVRATDGPASFRFVGGEGNNTLNLVRGTYSFSHDLSDGAANLTLNVGTDNVGAALVTLGATQNLAGLNLGPGALATMAVNGNRYLYTRGLSIDATAELDLNDNDLLLDYSGSSSSFYAAVKSHVTTGRATGTRGITSTAAAENQVHAPVDNAQFGRTIWMGRPIDTSTVIAKFTYFGDGNLDGKVTGDDYLAVDANLGLSNAQWFQGDFNFSNTTTGDDYLAIDANLGAGTAAPLSAASEDPATLMLVANSEPIAESDVQPLEVEVVAAAPAVPAMTKKSSKKLASASR